MYIQFNTLFTVKQKFLLLYIFNKHIQHTNIAWNTDSINADVIGNYIRIF